MLRERIFGQEGRRYLGHSIEIVNSGDTVHATLKGRTGRVKEDWEGLDEVKLWDCSLTEISGNSSIAVRAVLPRVLEVKFDREDNILKVFEIEPQAIIPS